MPLERLRAPLPVPTTSFYSETDGIVAWESCLADDGEQAENLAVRSSHCGMGHHPTVLLAIADRLAQPEGDVAPIRAARVRLVALRARAAPVAGVGRLYSGPGRLR